MRNFYFIHLSKGYFILRFLETRYNYAGERR